MSATVPSTYNRQRDIVIGLQIFMRYGGRFTSAEHDEFYAGPEGEPTFTDEEKKQLADAGWHYDEETSAWRIFT